MFAGRLLDRGRRETWLVCGAAILLVLVRSAAFTLSEGIYFDSDQAIIGLMAKHLSEFRAFPLFYYGQNYQLGVQAWLIAPFFWIARPSVAAMRVPLVVLGMIAAVVLVRTITTHLKVRPALAFVAALPFLVPTPVVAGAILITDGNGALVMLYILALWLLRSRPFTFGAVLALGYLHKEFTMYALPALVLVEAVGGWGVFSLATLKRIAWAVAGFASVWLAIDVAKIRLSGTSALLQMQMVGANACVPGADLLRRVGYVFTACLPVLSGGRVTALDNFGMRNATIVGSPLIGWLVCGAIVVMAGRLAWSLARRREGTDVSYGGYLTVVGCVALAAYPLSCGAMASNEPVIHYLYLALFLPIGLFAMFIAREPSKVLKAAAVGVFLVWAGGNFVDNARVLSDTVRHPAVAPHRELADFLLSHRIRYARAGYWDAYIVDFLANERVIVGSHGPVRIPEYEQRVDAQAANAAEIVRAPCDGDLRVSEWCIRLPRR